DWCIATESALEERPPPPAGVHGGLPIRVLPHGPDEETDRLFAVFTAAICRARREVLLVTPYFVPSGTMRDALRQAALGGVRVRLLLPARSDNVVADLAARRALEPILEAGADVRLAEGPFLHAKALVVDGAWSTFGSANFDQRSFHCNYEMNLEVPDADFAAALERHLAPDLANSRRLDPELFARRSIWSRALQNAANLFEPLL
ncbi:MAG: phospholipase D-like domain-containing protein, partial [Planctomycetota bacterium]